MGDEEDPWTFDAGDTEQSTQSNVNEEKISPISEPEAVENQATNTIENNNENDLNPEIEIELSNLTALNEDDGYRKPVQLYRHWVR